MISYLTHTIQKETGMWFSILPKNNHFPHAPWWHWKDGVQEGWMFNPSAELVAFLIHRSSEQSEAYQIGWSAIEIAINHVMNVKEMDRHQINNYQRLLKVWGMHEAMTNSKLSYSLTDITNKIISLAEHCVARKVFECSIGYKPLPLDFIDCPEHPLCEKFGDLVEKNLNYYVEKLADEGVWDVSWDWESYPEEFAVARRYWKGILTVDRYKILNSFGLLQ